MAPDPDRYDVVVLGAGISGLVGTSVLLGRGAGSVLVVDEYDHLGGNHIDVAVDGYTFDVGAFLFKRDSPLLAHFPELRDHYEPVRGGTARLNPQGRVAGYPFSAREDLWSAGPVELARILASAARGRVRRREPRSAGEMACDRLGARLVERSGLGHYMERLCGCPMDQIDVEFARSRMKWVERAGSPRQLRALLTGRRRPVTLDDETPGRFVRPRGGFAELYAPVRRSLEDRGAAFALGRPPTALRRTPDGFEVDLGDRTVRADRVVSTIPVARAAGLCGLPDPVLPTVTLLTLFYSFEGVRGFGPPILFNFTHRARWKRLTVYSDFYGPVRGREYLAVEVVTRPDGTTTVEAADRELREHTAAHDLLAGDLRLEGSHVLDHAYPVFTAGSRKRADRTRRALADLGVVSFGRQGGFDYQPTAKVATRAAEAALDRG